MAFSGVLRPGHVQIRVTDIDAATNHYRDVLGLNEVGTDSEGRAYLKAWDEHDHHSVVLREADSPGMDHLAWKVLDADTMKSLGRKIADSGIDVENVPAGEQPGVGERLRFTAPTGHVFDLYAEIEQPGNGLSVENPEVWPDGLHGMHPTRFDHVLLYGDDLDGSVKLFREILGFSLAEQVVTQDRSLMIGAFLTCSNKAHDIAFIRSEGKGQFHHASFYLESWHDIMLAADIVSRNGVELDIGPTRHGITRGGTIYFFDPSGNRNEVFCGGYQYYPDNPVLTWTDNELGKAIFYYDRKLNENFLGVTT